jgi:serine/threonine protein kinase
VSELSLLGELGSGQFGVVRRGRWTRVIDSTDHLTSKQPQVSNSKNKKDARQSPLPTTTKTVVFDVAVKLMKEGTMSEADFVREAKVMTRLKHPNLVQLFGLCIEHRPICIVTEYMKHGSLLSFLRKNSTTLKQNVLQLLHFCSQVCEGMTYLEQKNYIHRDLAARNCLVGEGSVVKVADFGLTRFVSDSNEYTSSSGTKFPIKWAPPEVLWFTKFSSKSDVWAFGVLMWEVFTCGQMPYGKCSNSQVVDLIREGKRLERPRLASKDVFDFMIACWEELPEDRPSFSVLLSRIRQQLKSSP